MMNGMLKEIMFNLREAKLIPRYEKDFYSVDSWKPSPCTIDYNKDKDFRLLYDGIYLNERGHALDFEVGIISNSAGYYEFFVEDYIGNSYCKCFSDFREALKLFIDYSYIRRPHFFKDDEMGNVVKGEMRVKPYAIVTK